MSPLKLCLQYELKYEEVEDCKPISVVIRGEHTRDPEATDRVALSAFARPLAQREPRRAARNTRRPCYLVAAGDPARRGHTARRN
jgi:hypothetical protein